MLSLLFRKTTTFTKLLSKFIYLLSKFILKLWGAIAYWLEGRTLNRENLVSNPTAVASNLWQV